MMIDSAKTKFGSLFRPFVGSINSGGIRQIAVEAGIEDRDLRDISA
jgi:hypothetical protein